MDSILSIDQPLCFIGDLHGRLNTLKRIISAYPQHHYVFVGDMIHAKRWFQDKTVSSFEMLGVVRELCLAQRATAVLGNNEYSVLANLLKPVQSVRKKELKSTLLDLQKMSFDNRMSWLRWLQDLPHFLVLGDYTVSHAYPSTAQELAVYGPKNREHWFKQDSPDLHPNKPHIFGHYGHPYVTNSVKCIDATNFSGVGVFISDPEHFLIFH